MMTLLTAIQGIVFIFAGMHFGPKWAIGGWLFFVAAAFQLAVTCMRLFKSDRTSGVTAVAGCVSLTSVAVVSGLHLQVAAHIITTFTPIGAATGWAVLGGLVAALPWLIALPFWQAWSTLRGSKKKVNLIAVLLVSLTAPAITCLADQGSDLDPVDLEAIASELWETASAGRPIEDTQSSLGTELIVTVARAGDSLPASTALEDGDALVVETIVRQREAHNHPLLPQHGTILSPGRDGVRLANGTAISPRSLLSSVRRLKAGAAAWLPGILDSEFDSPVEFVFSAEGWVISETSSNPLFRGWSTSEVTPYDAALAGAHQLARNSHPNGKFSYIIRGPSGRSKGGYNFPRHAGTGLLSSTTPPSVQGRGDLPRMPGPNSFGVIVC